MTTSRQADTRTAEGVAFGEKFGLYELLGAGAVSPREVADWSGLPETAVGHWLAVQASEGYVVPDGTGRYRCWSFIGQRG